jgi:Phospholipid methyltransferase
MFAPRIRTMTAEVSVPAGGRAPVEPGRHPWPLAWSWPELAERTRARFGRAELLGAELWVSQDHDRALHGRPVAPPGGRVVRWLVVLRGRPIVTAGVGEGVVVPLEPGSALAWDIDRDPVTIRSDGPWTAAALDFAAGPLARRRRAMRPTAVGLWFVDHVGADNALYTLLVVAASAAAASITLFVAATSFVHYAIYVSTYARRRGVDHGAFLRDAVYFKALSMASLAWIVAASPPWSGVGGALIVAGVALSLRAALVLGVERTYFGVELGRVAPLRIERFPYGTIPHPMIVGAIAALVGVGLQPGVYTSWPWLVPAHVVAYSIHLAQEVSASTARQRHPIDARGR